MQILEKERKRLCETTVSDYIIYNYICSFVLHRFFLMRHEIDLVVLAVLTVVQFILNFVIYTVLEKVDKS